jgi:hypothetical protein
LPEGAYAVDPKDTQYRFDVTVKAVPSLSPPFVQSITAYSHPLWANSSAQGSAWGNYRTVLTPDAGTNLQGRDPNGFFVHGGDSPGSAGCIDLTGQNDAFHQFLKQYGKPITLTVRYTCDPWKRSANQRQGGLSGFGGGGFFWIPWWMYSLQDFLNWLDTIQVPKAAKKDEDHLA